MDCLPAFNGRLYYVSLCVPVGRCLYTFWGAAKMCEETSLIGEVSALSVFIFVSHCGIHLLFFVVVVLCTHACVLPVSFSPPLLATLHTPHVLLSSSLTLAGVVSSFLFHYCCFHVSYRSTIFDS